MTPATRVWRLCICDAEPVDNKSSTSGSNPIEVDLGFAEGRPFRAARSGVRPIGSALREQLLGDIGKLESDDEAADWVHKNLAAKNALIGADADLVEAGFREKLATIELASTARH
jgi:hypothetical protein